MPEQYVAMRDKFKEDGMSDQDAKAKAAAIYNSKHKEHPVTNKPDYTADNLNALRNNITKEQEALYPKKTFGEKMGVSLSTEFSTGHYQGPSGKFAPNPKNAVKTPAEGELEIGKLPKTGSYLSKISEAELASRASKLDSNKVYTHKALTQHLKLHPNSSQHAIEKLEKLGFVTKHINGFKRSQKNAKPDFSAIDQVKANIAKEQSLLYGAQEETFLAYDYDSTPDYGTDLSPTGLESVNTYKNDGHNNTMGGNLEDKIEGSPKVGVPQIPTLKNFESDDEDIKDSTSKMLEKGVKSDSTGTLGGILPENDKKSEKSVEKSSKNGTDAKHEDEKSGIMNEENEGKEYLANNDPTTPLDRAKDLAEIAQRQVAVATEALRGCSVTNEQKSRVEAAKIKLKEALEYLENIEHSDNLEEKSKKPEDFEADPRNFSKLTNFEATQINLDRVNPELINDISASLYILGKNNPTFTPKTIKVDFLDNNAVANINKDQVTFNYRYVNNPKLTSALLQREFQGNTLKSVLTTYGTEQLMKKD